MAVNVLDESGDTPLLDSPGGLSDLAMLRKDAESYDPKPLRYVHPTIPKYILVFRHDLDYPTMQKWQKLCTTNRNGRNPDVDNAKFNELVICGTSLSIEVRDNLTEMHGRAMLDSKGDPLSFVNKEFLRSFDVATAADAVKAFIISDPAIAALAAKIIEDNGVGDEVEALPDPTDDAGS